MRPRGYALVFGLAALTAIVAGVVMLSSSMISRVEAQRSGERREAALHRAENALEQARAAMENGTLKAGGTFSAEKLSVLCAAIPSGARLEVLSVLENSQRRPSSKAPRRGVRVSWDLVQTPGRSDWRRTNWSANNETLP